MAKPKVQFNNKILVLIRLALISVSVVMIFLLSLLLRWENKISDHLIGMQDSISQVQNQEKEFFIDTTGDKYYCYPENGVEESSVNNMFTKVDREFESATEQLSNLISINWLLFVLILFNPIFILLSFVVEQTIDKRNESNFQIKLQKTYDRGYEAGVSKTILTMDEDVSLLRNMVVWLHLKSQPMEEPPNNSKKIIDNLNNKLILAEVIFKQFLNKLRSQFGLQQIGEIDAVTEFNQNFHSTFDRGLKSGDLVIIESPGWKLNNEIIRKAIVGRKNE